jgi:hypothetical protein
LGDVLPAIGSSNEPGFSVNFTTSGDEGEIEHHQLFTQEGVVAWSRGHALDACLQVRRSTAVDLLDHLGRGGPDAIAARSQFNRPGSRKAVGVLGLRQVIHSIPLLDPSKDGVSFDAALVVTDSPFGDLSTCMSVCETLISVSYRRCDHAHVHLELPYSVALSWLHGSTILGHAIHAGYRVRGDLGRLSYLEGLVSGPRRSDEVVDVTLIDHMENYARSRRTSASLLRFDRIEELTD